MVRPDSSAPKPQLSDHWTLDLKRSSQLFLAIAICWTFIIAGLALWETRKARVFAMEMARIEAISTFHKDIAYRRWATKHGGVYVPLTPETQPNPYLAHIPERDITTQSGRKLTLMNPAYMTRQVHEMSKDQYGVRGHITSLKPLRPENAPDAWEAAALLRFESGAKEVSSLELLENDLYMRLMMPMVTEAGCLKCHGHQGYKVGDIRGGISISVPFRKYQDITRLYLSDVYRAFAVIWMIGLAGLWLGQKKIRHALLVRKKAADDLIESEERFHTVADFTSGWEYWINPQNQVVYMSPSCEKITGYAPSEFIADADLLDRIVASDHAAVYELHKHDRLGQRGSDDQEEMEFCIVTRKGDRRWIHHICRPIYSAKGDFRGVRVSNRDITERKNAADSIKTMVNEQKIILDNLGVGVLFLKDRKILWANRSLAKIFGYSVDEAIGRDTEIFYPDGKSYIETGEAGYAALSRGEVYTADLQMKKKNGTLIWCNIIGQAVNAVDLEQGAIWLIEDITDRKLLETELIKARNLESLGILAGGIAHDFNNLLQGLLGNIDMAKIHTPETSRAFPFLKNAELAYHAAVSLTNQLIAFAAGGTSARRTIQPAELIKESVLILMSGSNIRTVFDLPDDLFNLYVDTSQLRQAIGNITLNAQDAMPSGGVLIVSASNEILKSQDIPGLKPGTYIKISIKDQGCGIASELLPKIFDPYFSTKERGAQRGMGLGLTVSDAIVRKHNGLLKVESEVGKGSTFHIYLPAAVPTSEMSTIHRDAADKGLRVLIMDDEAAVYKIAVDYLTFIGYRAEVATNGDEAIRAYAAAQEAGDPYAVVILDLSIPEGMGGQEAFVRLRELDPKVKAIVSSGYANDPIMGDYSLYGYQGALAKPYRLETLKQMLERILSNP
ncbi:MAG: PAS domain S-box protein [Nitrospirae bacterium]|nr:PAS domain S-box protein [Nitrospirota bacterium]